MAESQNEISSSRKPKEKKSIVDDEFGKEFLSSWKSMSVAEDDSMDFSFNTVSPGKKKTLNFGRLDMDFDLGGDFDKLSSFKMDVPDLDFASSPTKAPKSNERSKAVSSGGSGRKNRDTISFSFDFNELDNFNFDSALMNGGEKSVKNISRKGVDSDRSECQDLKIKINQLGDAEATNNGQSSTKMIPVAEDAMTSFVKTAVACFETGNLSDNIASESETVGGSVASHENALEKRIIASAEKPDQLSDSLDKAMQREAHGEQVLHILSAQSQGEGGKDSARETVSDVQTKLFSHCAELDAEHNVVDETPKVASSDEVNLQQKSLNSLTFIAQENCECQRERTESKTPTENNMGTEPPVNDIDYEATSAASLSHGSEVNKHAQNSTLKDLVSPRSETAGDNMTQVQEKESAVVCSKFYRVFKDTERQDCQRSTGGTESSTLGRKGISVLHFGCPANGREPVGRKLAGDLKSTSGEVTKADTSCIGSEKNVVSLGNMREGSNADSIQKGCKLVCNSKTLDSEVNKQDAVMLGSTKNIKTLSNVCHEVSPANSNAMPKELNHKTNSNPWIGLSSVGLIRNSKINSTEGLKTGNIAPDLSSLKIVMAVEQVKDQSSSSLKSELSRNANINMERQANAIPRSVHPVAHAERKMPVITSLKRKTFQASKTDIEASNPHKRLSASPHESSNFKEPTASIVHNQDNLDETTTKTVTYYHQTSGCETPVKVNVEEPEITSALEDDGYVEKAEAYAKELEDICNMLKKKHEEAKETLVRAVVNNNSLLMLNHPMHDEKIRLVQKFAARLMSQ